MFGISQVGMVSSLGRDAGTSCAAARCGITMLSELENGYFDEETLGYEAIKGCVVSGVTEGFEGLGRWVQLGRYALSDLFDQQKLSKVELKKTAVLLNLNDFFYLDSKILEEISENSFTDEVKRELWSEYAYEKSENQNQIKTQLIDKIFSLNGVEPKEIPVKEVYFGGSAGFISLVEKSILLMQDMDIDRCIIGGIDSFVQPNALQDLIELNLIFTNQNNDGFIPGEAAAFVIIEKINSAKTRNIEINCIIESTAQDKSKCNIFSEHKPDGLGLFSLINKLISGLNGVSIVEIGNLNGTHFRSLEYSNSIIIRNKNCNNSFNQEFIEYMEHFGEIGSATAPVSLCVVLMGVIRGYINAELILIWLISDNGDCGGLLVRKI